MKPGVLNPRDVFPPEFRAGLNLLINPRVLNPRDVFPSLFSLVQLGGAIYARIKAPLTIALYAGAILAAIASQLS
jgi:hypothetical protein